MSPDRNQIIASHLREAADLHEQQQANPFRVRAYREAARTIEALDEDVGDLVDREGRKGLTALEGVGDSIAAAIEEMLRTGRWSQLERLRGELDPEMVFQSIPGVGKTLAHEIHEALGVDTLAALEVAAHDGRLAEVPGVGDRRAAMIRAALAEMLARPKPSPGRREGEEPAVAALLDVDEEYRTKAEKNVLRKIAPKRFNPSGEAWLPVLHTQRGDWQFTVLFSNTARAHELDKTHDWVVVYFHHDNQPEAQRTIVTEHRGALVGRRVVRGRERECRAYYGLD